VSKPKPVICYLLRHADAGSRGIVNDAERGLTKKGRGQADRIARSRAGSHITSIASSPYVRCLETVEPLGRAIGLAVEVDESLGEGAGPTAAIARIEAASQPMVLCSHGDVIGEVLALLGRRGIELDHDRLAKGSTWEIAVDHGTIRSAHYVPPPA
jgi:8-oxo-dGTP diphosphatase